MTTTTIEERKAMCDEGKHAWVRTSKSQTTAYYKCYFCGIRTTRQIVPEVIGV